MGIKTALVIGLGVGYVVGTRAGRERYDQIMAAALRLRHVPIIAKPIDAAADKVAEKVREKGGEITDAVADSVKEKLFGVREEPLVIEAQILR